MTRLLVFALLLALAPFAAQGATCPGNAAWQYNSVGSTQTMSQTDDLTGSGACENNMSLNVVGGKAVVPEPCQSNTPTYTQISVAATGPTQIVPATSGKQTYICHVFIAPVTAAVSLTLIQGTGTNCATSPTALFGGTTAATGAVMAINEGFQLGDGLATILAPTVSGGAICLTASAATQISGSIKTVAQ